MAAIGCRTAAATQACPPRRHVAVADGTHIYMYMLNVCGPCGDVITRSFSGAHPDVPIGTVRRTEPRRTLWLAVASGKRAVDRALKCGPGLRLGRHCLRATVVVISTG